MTANTASHAFIDADVLAEQLASERPPHLIDVRTPGEFASCHIPGACNIPLDILRKQRSEITRCLTGPVVLVCQSGQRAEQACRCFGEIGVAETHVLRGGMAAWQQAGQPIQDDGIQRWALERQIRLVAGSIVLGSTLLSTVLPRAKWVAGFIGAGLTFAALTNTCAMGALLSKLPYNRPQSCDVSDITERLRQGS